MIKAEMHPRMIGLPSASNKVDEAEIVDDLSMIFIEISVNILAYLGNAKSYF
jgi:hypothetical protein